MTVSRMSVATVTASLAAEISLCAVIVYNHRLGQRYNRSIKPAPGRYVDSTLNISRVAEIGKQRAAFFVCISMCGTLYRPKERPELSFAFEFDPWTSFYNVFYIFI